MRHENDSRVNEIIISLPICVGLQISLVRLLQSWGIRPTGVTGHSSGEVGAAYIAGAIDIKSAMAIVYTRGSLTTRFQEVMDRRGGMVAVGLGRDDANSYISRLTTGQVIVACVNSPRAGSHPWERKNICEETQGRRRISFTSHAAYRR
jgi:acyl transferase domain-containing protein